MYFGFLEYFFKKIWGGGGIFIEIFFCGFPFDLFLFLLNFFGYVFFKA